MTIRPDFNDLRSLEKYSSAYTLSDMEIFVFPDLMYSLVLANIMSPIIWTWRDDPWFREIDRKSANYKINRIKQYIMDHYVFNLDLETWGLTTKEQEIERFKTILDTETLRQSNALFGYEGDKYYFDIDIRRHFGLDQYDTNIIPYWKTETIEAMTAFCHRPSFQSGAGECVSFAALYAAALFIVGKIPLENIYMMGTPLHSQNFIDLQEGLLTNNRRIVTKKMWFNGTSISTRARRALENEKVTIVAHLSGYIHHLYGEATIDQESYLRFADKLRSFLTIPVSPELFINFLRYHMKFKKCFQYRHPINARNHYVPLETIFEYEHSTKFVFTEENSSPLLNEIDDEEFCVNPLPNRLVLQQVLELLRNNPDATLNDLMNHCHSLADCHQVCFKGDSFLQLFSELGRFLTVDPRLPSADKTFFPTERIPIRTDQSREEIIECIRIFADRNETAHLACYAYRLADLDDWRPMLKAALERNPVSLAGLGSLTAAAAYESIRLLSDESIYNEKRLAQPDEVWNFGRGDGVEKAMLMANYLRNCLQTSNITLSITKDSATVETATETFTFPTSKGLPVRTLVV
ncbi:MAG: hypothetical protein LWW85_00775 [Marinilabiliales bacterium]|nr:hypothetical protein [Marinilabiliales bacterium]